MILWVLGLYLCTETTSAEVLSVSDLATWDVLDMAGDGEVRTTRLLNAPPGFGPNGMSWEHGYWF